MRSLIIIATILLCLTLYSSSQAYSGQTVSGSFICDIDFVDGNLEATNCEVFDIEIR